MKETWTILPLEGKYYGTQISNGCGNLIEVWITPKEYKPSEREISNGWEHDYGMDHVETQENYDLAKKIVAALNGDISRLVAAVRNSQSDPLALALEIQKWENV